MLEKRGTVRSDEFGMTEIRTKTVSINVQLATEADLAEFHAGLADDDAAEVEHILGAVEADLRAFWAAEGLTDITRHQRLRV